LLVMRDEKAVIDKGYGVVRRTEFERVDHRSLVG
jgi:hypothetical protein